MDAQLVVAVDVGIRNLSFCAMWCPPQLGCAGAAVKTLAEVRGRLPHMRLAAWEVVPLSLSRTLSFADRAAAVADFARARESMFCAAAVVVIEHQMQSVMRSIAASLFSCVRLLGGADVRLATQQAKEKLSWADLAEEAGRADTHAQRKRRAVGATRELLGLPSAAARGGARRGAGGAALSLLSPPLREGDAAPPFDALRRVFLAASKKDDLADSFLHLCAYDCAHNPPPLKRARRAEKKRACDAAAPERGTTGAVVSTPMPPTCAG